MKSFPRILPIAQATASCIILDLPERGGVCMISFLTFQSKKRVSASEISRWCGLTSKNLSVVTQKETKSALDISEANLRLSMNLFLLKFSVTLALASIFVD